MGYWEDRQAATQAALTKKNIAQTEKQLRTYYRKARFNAMGKFMNTYNHIYRAIEAGREPTPADLYKLDTYWQLQGEIREELIRLGDKNAAEMSKRFMAQWQDIYNSYAIRDEGHFSKIDYQAAQQMINEIWCADGKSWSSRIWTNIGELQEALNEELLNCLINGNSPRQLRERLMYQFNVSWSKADSLVRTEMAHIQTKAAEQRYKDGGIKRVQVWADEDERRCDVCGNLHEKVYMIGEKIPIPAHPRCRCCIVPVIE